MNSAPKYIRFDWAMKRMLRNKANFGVLEGFLTTLLKEKITINRLLESESNQEDEYDKYNRVDILAENSKGDLVLIEVQNNNEYAYFQRMLFGTSKLVTEYINRGEGYEKVRKIYSVNIVYFALGHGSDYAYHGKTEFRGINTQEILNLSPFQRQKFEVDAVSDLYPEYYILKVNDFNRVATTPLEEWIYYLNTGNVAEESTAPGLDEVRKHLELDRMTRDELKAYYRHLDNVVILKDNIYTERAEGLAEGLAKGLEEGLAKGLEKGREEGLADGLTKGLKKGREEGRKEGEEEGRKKAKIDLAKSLLADGIPIDFISKHTGLSEDDIMQE